MAGKWLYQVRIKVSEKISTALRGDSNDKIASEIKKIGKEHGLTPVCTFDAFVGYCLEAEEEGIEKYPLYRWTKQTIENPTKKDKHIRSFAFYSGLDQVYEKERAESLIRDLQQLLTEGQLDELRLIDSNPANNPQPPSDLIS